MKKRSRTGLQKQHVEEEEQAEEDEEEKQKGITEKAIGVRGDR